MTAPRFVRVGAVLAAATTALVAAFPLWGVAEAQTSSVALTSYQGRGHDRGDHAERHGRDNKPTATCTITVPDNPLTAQGLATPYVLNDGDVDCSMANDDTAAFVEATIVDPAGKLSVYRPQVVTNGTQPAAPPVVPTIAPGSTVGIWFGFQGDTLKLVGDGVGQGNCVNGLGRSVFGQFAYCNAPQFFAAARGVTAPALGQAADGKPCPTVRDFFVVDQDQSDNVSTVYRINAQGQTAQDTAATAATIPNKVVNASDNGLLNRKINLALGCANFTAPDLTGSGAEVPSLALNEIQGKLQQAPVAMIPLNNPMAKVGDRESIAKVNLYRLGVGQPPTGPQGANGTTYCANLQTIQPPRLADNEARLRAVAAPGAATPADGNLFDFMQERYTASLGELGCAG
jgi:hypothetical protein